MENFGFIILRHVNNEEFNLFWQECYLAIRKFYDNKIIILDNNSNENFIKTDLNLENCEIIKADYPQNRLYSPFYHYLVNDFNFEKAVIIHDGVLLNEKIDFQNIEDIKYFWHFDTNCPSQNHREISQLNSLNNSKDLMELYNSNLWKGCLGSMAVISKKFIQKLQDKYNILALINMINDQEDAISFERVLAVLCYKEKPELDLDPSIAGNISSMNWGYRYHQYHNDKLNNTVPKDKIIKLFGARK